MNIRHRRRQHVRFGDLHFSGKGGGGCPFMQTLCGVQAKLREAASFAHGELESLRDDLGQSPTFLPRECRTGEKIAMPRATQCV